MYNWFCRFTNSSVVFLNFQFQNRNSNYITEPTPNSVCCQGVSNFRLLHFFIEWSEIGLLLTKSYTENQLHKQGDWNIIYSLLKHLTKYPSTHPVNTLILFVPMTSVWWLMRLFYWVRRYTVFFCVLHTFVYKNICIYSKLYWY